MPIVLLQLDVPWEARPLLKRKQGVTIGRKKTGREEGGKTGRDAKEGKKEEERKEEKNKQNRTKQTKSPRSTYTQKDKRHHQLLKHTGDCITERGGQHSTVKVF